MNKLSIFDTHCHLADKEYHNQDRNTKEISWTKNIQELRKLLINKLKFNYGKRK